MNFRNSDYLYEIKHNVAVVVNISLVTKSQSQIRQNQGLSHCFKCQVISSSFYDNIIQIFMRQSKIHVFLSVLYIAVWIVRATRHSDIVVLPPRCGPLSPGQIFGPGAVCPFGFQSQLASTGFSPGTPVFLLHLKLDFFSFVSFYSFRGPFWKAVLVH